MLFIALPGIVVGAVHRLPNTDMNVLLGFLPLVLQTLAPYVLPIGFLLAVVTTYGRLAADREWIAIQMAGFRPLAMLLPALGLALVLGLVTFWMVSTQLPLGKKRQKEFLLEAAQSSLLHLNPGVTHLQYGDFYLNAAFLEDGVFRDVIIYKPGETEADDVRVIARTASIRQLGDDFYIELTDAQPLGDEIGGIGRSESLRIKVPLEEFMQTNKRHLAARRYLTSMVIWKQLQDPAQNADLRRGHIYELNHRTAISTSFMLFLLLGAPTGLLLRRGTQLGALSIAVGYALLYHILSMRVGKELSLAGVLHPAIGAWMTTICGALVGVFLLNKARKR